MIHACLTDKKVADSLAPHLPHAGNPLWLPPYDRRLCSTPNRHKLESSKGVYRFSLPASCYQHDAFAVEDSDIRIEGLVDLKFGHVS